MCGGGSVALCWDHHQRYNLVVAYCSIATRVSGVHVKLSLPPTEGVVLVTCLLVLLDVHCSLFSFTWLAARAKSWCGTNQ